jgi:hypothetical protein
VRLTISSLTALALATALCPASADEAIPGKIILARASEDAVILYDATPEVIAIVHDKLDDAAAGKRLERDALLVLAKEMPDIPDARTITVRVTYTRTGDVNPAYGTPTFAGIERYANLIVPAGNARSDRGNWRQGTEENAPAWASFTIVGELPPR